MAMNLNNYNIAEKKYMKRGLIRGGLLLFKANDAIELIELCRELKISILGVDGFYLKKDEIRPSLEDSLDLGVEKEFDRYSRAIRFIQERKSDKLYFEIVCSEN